MLVVFIEIISIAALATSLRKRGLSEINKTVIMALLWQALIILIYRMELYSIGRDVYYSDAEVYWNNTKQLLAGGKLSGSQTGYAYFCALIQLTSVVQNVVWNNISNVLLVDIAVLMIGKYMSDQKRSIHNIGSFISVCIYNPLVIYSLTRNLKDALFLFLAVCIVCSYMSLFNRHKVIKIILLAVLTIAISTVRPWGFLITAALVFERIFTGTRKTTIKRLCVFGIIFTAAVLLIRATGLWFHVQVWLPIVLENTQNQSLVNLLLAPAKILTGPGPYRALLGSTYFMFYTNSGNIFTALGCLIWWWNLSCFVAGFRKPTRNMVAVCFGLVWVLFIGIYSMQYGGSLELRFRGVVYVLTSAMLFSLQERPIRHNVISFKILMIFSVLFVVGTVFSL